MSVKRLERATSSQQRQREISAKAGPPTSLVLRPSSKIRDHHWERLAIVYIRQSSPHQVLENRESRERQYALATLAQQFGWPADRVLVIDEDQGLSGKFSENRDGFQRLLTEVTLDHVGLVLGLELSRLARSCKDWHHLVEVCAVFDTLLYDQDGVYNANDSNDRLLLGMKGAMSEYELITLRNRLERGRDNKAARGELFLHLPIGYIKSPSGEVHAGTGRTGSRRRPVGLRQVRGIGHGVAECFATSSGTRFNSAIAACVARNAVSWNGVVPRTIAFWRCCAIRSTPAPMPTDFTGPVARTRSPVKSKAASGSCLPMKSAC